MEKLLVSVTVLALMLLLTISILAQDSSTIEQVDFDSATLNRTYQYIVYLPAGYADSNQSYPVVYLLHGRGDTMDAWLNVRDALDELIANATIPPMIAIMPDMPSSDRAGYYVDSQYEGTLFHAEPVETAFMNDLIPHVDATYRTITSREGRIIGGYSMGGYGALRYAMIYPERFIGAIVLSPAVYIPLPPVDSSTREFGAFGTATTLFDEDIYRNLNYPALMESLQASELPLYIFIAVGDDEWKNPRPEDQLHDLDMEAHMVFNHLVRVSNVSAEFRVYNGGHDWEVWQRGFIEGMQYIANFLSTDGNDSGTASELGGIRLDSGSDDFAGGITTDNAGNVYLAVGATGAINNGDYAGGMDVALLKYNPDGDLQWTTQFGTSATERPYGIALDSSGNVIVAGYTNGNLDGNHSDNSGDDIFVAQFNSDGQQQWVLQFGDAQEADRGYALTVASNDSIYVGGYTKGALNGTNAGDKDIILAQITSEGALAWVEQFGGFGEDKGLDLAIAPDGTLYLAGVTGSELETTIGDLDAFLAAYAPDGQQLWVRQFGSVGWDEATAVTTSADGTVYVTGFAAGDFAEHRLAGDKDIFVAAFSPDGTMFWSDEIGTNLNDKGADILLDNADNIIVAAYSNGNLAGSIGGFDVVLLHYDADHNQRWVQQIGTLQDDGTDQWAEKNLMVTLSDDMLLLSGLTGDTAEDGSGDVFLTIVPVE